jgi:hypothetical protein
MLITVPRTGTLDGVVFATTTANISDSVKVSFQDIAAGNVPAPDGVVDQYRDISPGANTENYTGIMSDDGTDLGVKRSVTKGQRLAVVWTINTWQAGDSMRVVHAVGGDYLWPNGVAARRFGAVWAPIGSAYLPALALKYDDGNYARVNRAANCGVFSGNQGIGLTGGGASERLYIKFTAPETCDLNGILANVNYSGAVGAGDFSLNVLDSGKSLLGTERIVWNTIFPDVNVGRVEFTLSTPVSLTKGETYYIGVVENSGSVNTPQWSTFALDSSRDAFNSIYGIDSYLVSNLDVWTIRTNFYTPCWSLLLNNFQSAAGGGVVVPQGLHTIDQGIIA